MLIWGFGFDSGLGYCLGLDKGLRFVVTIQFTALGLGLVSSSMLG